MASVICTRSLGPTSPWPATRISKMTTTKTHLCHYDQPLYHVGDMNGKPWPTSSMEGLLLSCSPYPEDWRAIARLGQAPIWTLQRLDGKPPKLVNFRRLSRSDKKRWLAKAQELDLIHSATLFKAQAGDDDQYTICLTLEEARQESESWVKPTKGWLPKPALNKFWYGSEKENISPFFAMDAAFTFLAKQIPGIDGIWWDDSYDPGNLSAPRVGIFPEKVKRLRRMHKIILLG